MGVSDACLKKDSSGDWVWTTRSAVLAARKLNIWLHSKDEEGFQIFGVIEASPKAFKPYEYGAMIHNWIQWQSLYDKGVPITTIQKQLGVTPGYFEFSPYGVIGEETR